MAKKASPETVIHEYFQTADINKAEVVFEFVKATMKKRQGENKPAPIARKTASKRASKKTEVADEQPTIGHEPEEEDNN